MEKFNRLYLREWRLFKGLTGQQLADLSGITRSEVSRLEHGNRRLTMNHAKLLGDALGIQPEDFTRLPEGALANSGSIRVPKSERPDYRIMVAGARFMVDEPIKFIPTSSDEMRPTFVPGDYVAINTSQSRIDGAGVYYLTLDGVNCLRRIQVVGKTAKVICDNDRYETVDKLADRLTVIGRAVAVVKAV